MKKADIAGFSGLATVEENLFCSRDILRMKLSCPELGRKAYPGQFLMVKTARQKSDDPLLPRPFSFHWADSTGFEILYKVVGRGTSFLAGLKSGDKLSVYGPLGRGFDIKPGKKQLLVGGGMGVAPLLYLAGYIRSNYPDNEIEIIVGARCLDEVVEMNRFNQVGVDSIKVATEDGSEGAKGLVTDLLKKTAKPSQVYSCGPIPMLKAVSKWCRENKLPCQVSIESVMACGMGACLGCAVEGSKEGSYLHVCSDGPVFDSEDLWNDFS